ncbi:MAG TPA: F0F1 ATP synthase subunit epsilon [Candidatus Saccharimonadales bacterium]|nr:F0F1 ATP synthase subunit epsilon [Candidatus Saccharimonadales bacterium]
MKADAMDIKIYAPFQVYFNGTADSLSANNDTGPFDVLPHHKNFMSLLKPGPITVRQKGKPDFSMKIDRGIVHVRNNKVSVFLDV